MEGKPPWGSGKHVLWGSWYHIYSKLEGFQPYCRHRASRNDNVHAVACVVSADSVPIWSSTEVSALCLSNVRLN